MAQDVRQWLDEIKRLQQQLTEVSRDRLTVPGESAAQWRQLYNTEAEQRRNDAKLTQQSIASLEAQIEQLQNFSPIMPEGDDAGVARQQEVEKLETVGELKAKLAEVLQERDRAIEQVKQLTQALKQEEARHAETSKNLTTALGDAVDLLTKAQNPAPGKNRDSILFRDSTCYHPKSGRNCDLNRRNPAQLSPSKNQLLQLPPFGS